MRSVFTSLTIVINILTTQQSDVSFQKYKIDTRLIHNGALLQGYKWTPAGEIRALVFISHGFAEWLGGQYFQELAESGAYNGLLMFGHDHAGHGLSSGRRANIGDVDEYVWDILHHCRITKLNYPHLPLFIIGHSMGGLVAVQTVLTTQTEKLFRGAVISSPLLRLAPDMDTPVNRLLAKVFSVLMPELSNGRALPDSTSDPDWLNVIENDELFWKGGDKAAFSQAIITKTDELRPQYTKFRTPFLMFTSMNDTLVDTEAIIEFYRKSSTEDKRIEFYNDGIHHFYIEKLAIRREVTKNAIQWILNRIH